MKELELLGLQPDSDLLTLNDSEGNRYVLPITDALRAALRRDRANIDPNEPDRQMSPREIQAYIREGMSVDEVCELSALPASRVAALAHPIIAEREYTARVARSFSIGNERGGLTIEELVASRLLGRGVKPDDIGWDSLRKSGEPWTLVATFVTGDREHRASWHVDLDRRALEALDDEGSWLSETQFPVSNSPWRPANTPPAPVAQIEQKAPEKDPIEDVLDSLDQQRGRVQPMPTEPFEGAHPAASEPEQATDATVLTLPRRSVSKHRAENEGKADGPQPGRKKSRRDAKGEPAKSEEDEGATSPAATAEAVGDSKAHTHTAEAQDALLEGSRSGRRRRGSRPSMPSWDEIVFGKKD